MLRRKAITLIGALTLVSALMVAVAPAASANVGPCSGGVTNVGLTVKDGDNIRGSGSMACPYRPGTSVRLEVSLQRLTGLGWRGVDYNARGWAATPVNWRLSVAWNCSDTGTYSYRTRVTGLASPGGPRYLTSNTIRVRC